MRRVFVADRIKSRRWSKTNTGFQAFKLSGFQLVKAKKYLGSLGLVCALLLSYGAAQEAYYPATPGLTWTYSNGETQSLSGPRDFNGKALSFCCTRSRVPPQPKITSFTTRVAGVYLGRQ